MQDLPSPMDLLLDPVSLIVLSIYAGLMMWEALWPARTLPKVRNWRLKGMISFLLFFFLSSYLPLWIDPWMSVHLLFDLSGVGMLGGAVVGILGYQLIFYVYHRCVHHFNGLWRVLHQMHHSAERIDTFGAFYFSPVEMISFTFIGSFVFAFLIGLSPQAITVVILGLNFFSIFQHANINTPVWLGYFIQRPESHSVHHGRGLHKFNYSDVPIWDILFGTFYNPRTYENENGFFEGSSTRVKDMLLFKDINRTQV
ncbi:MAG: sterol desaturase family protein [Cytophagales bacterium]|nr:sterol desaturase family protein [Cytophagales bacterium]